MSEDPSQRSSHIPPGYVPLGAQPPPTRSGPLLAAGVMAIVESVPLLLLGLFALAATDAGRGDGMFDDLIAVLGLVAAGLGGAWLLAGIGGVLRRQWGRVLLIIGNSLAVLVSLPGLVDGPVILIPAALAATGLGLAIAGQPRRLQGETPSAPAPVPPPPPTILPADAPPPATGFDSIE